MVNIQRTGDAMGSVIALAFAGVGSDRRVHPVWGDDFGTVHALFQTPWR